VSGNIKARAAMRRGISPETSEIVDRLLDAARPPDLAALLHPWTCTSGFYTAEEHTDGGWLCQRAAADIAFRLAPKEPPWPDHADMSVDERPDIIESRGREDESGMVAGLPGEEPRQDPGAGT
jgi:hypothetical protein